MFFAARFARFLSSSACRPCSPGEMANAVSIRTTPVSKSSSGTPSRQPELDFDTGVVRMDTAFAITPGLHGRQAAELANLADRPAKDIENWR